MSDVHSATCVRCGRAGGIRVEYQIGAATTIDFVRRRKHDSCDRAAKNLARLGGRNSVVECQLPKLDVAGSTPVARSRRTPDDLGGFLLFLLSCVLGLVEGSG